MRKAILIAIILVFSVFSTFPSNVEKATPDKYSNAPFAGMADKIDVPAAGARGVNPQLPAPVEKAGASVDISIQTPVINAVGGTPSGPLQIFDDATFDTMALNLNWPGSGTASDPYIIEKYSFSGTANDVLIYISSVTRSFVIRNNTFTGSAYGINLYNVKDVRIEDNAFTGNSVIAIDVGSSQNVNITRNNVTRTGDGIQADGSFIDISYNYILNSSLDGVHIQAMNSRVSNNVIINSTRDGILLYNCDTVTVDHNRVEQSGNTGIDLGLSYIGANTNVNVTNSIVKGSKYIGINFQENNGIRVENTIVSDSGDMGIYIYNSGSATVKNVEITSSQSHGLSIFQSPAVTVENVTISNSKNWGASIDYASQLTFINSNITHNSYDGVALGPNNNTNFQNNYIAFNGWDGINVYRGLNISITGNSIMNNTGIGLDLWYQDQVQIASNTIKYNGWLNDDSGIKLRNSNYSEFSSNEVSNNGGGMYILDSMYTTIASSQINNNTKRGITFDTATNATVTSTKLMYNDEYGVRVFASTKILLTELIITGSGADGVSIVNNSSDVVVELSTITESVQDAVAISDSNYIEVLLNDLSYSKATGLYGFNVDGLSVIQNLVTDNQATGIDLFMTFNNTSFADVSNNIVKRNGGAGISIFHSWIDVVKNNVVSESGIQGIYNTNTTTIYTKNIVNGSDNAGIQVFNSSFVDIVKNSLYGNKYGIYLTSDESTYIDNNAIYENKLYGILLYVSNNSYITDNSILFNKIGGITSLGSSTIIDSNNIVQNKEWGLSIDTYSKNVNVTNNAFRHNPLQAMNNASSSMFDFNYWSDWQTPDDNNDTIVDIPYSIPGTANSQDPHPKTTFVNPPTPPLLAHLFFGSNFTMPTDVTYNGSITLEWSAPYDSFDHQLTSELFYSADDGATWVSIMLSTEEVTRYVWDFSTIFGGPTVVKFRIRVSESTGLQIDGVSDPVKLDPQATSSTSTSISPTTSSQTSTPPTTSTSESTSSAPSDKPKTSQTEQARMYVVLFPLLLPLIYRYRKRK